MRYKEARDYIAQTAHYGSVLGLQTIRLLMQRLGNPQDDLRFIHIAGTNGKGSVSAFLTKVLMVAGYRVGRYNSPAVIEEREFISFNEKYISREDYAEILSEVSRAADAMEVEGLAHPTAFEIETAMAFIYYKKKECQVVVLETGLGGSEDATNIVKNTDLVLFTSISRDHVAVLGNSIEEITRQKVGIIKPGCSVVMQKGRIGSKEHTTGMQRIITEKCKEMNVELVVADPSLAKNILREFPMQTFSYKKDKDVTISMAATYQIDNAVLVLEAVNQLCQKGYIIKRSQLLKGMKTAVWAGRFTIVGNEPLMIVDGAHNEDGVRRLVETIEMYFTNRRIIYIMGVLKDKEYEKMCELVAHLATDMITVSTSGERSLSALTLAECASRYHNRVTAADSVREALEISLLLANSDAVIIAFGSLSYLGEVIRIMKNKEQIRRDSNDRQK